MKRKKTMILIAGVFLASTGAAALQGHVVTSGPTEVNDMIYTWGSSDTTPYYQDAQAYDDVGLMICSDSGGTPSDRYVGLEYLMNNEVNARNQLVSYGDQNLAMADISTTFNGNQCKRTSFGSFVVSPSVISGTPETKIAAFPSRANILVSDSSDGSNPQSLSTNSQLKGSYSGSINYEYSGNQLNVNLNSITVDSDQGLKNFDPGTAGRGVTEDRPLLIGACRDQIGQNCPAGVDKITSPSGASNSFGLDIAKSSVNDQNVYTRYAVANGKRFGAVNIGADLEVGYTSVSRNTIYYSQNQTVDIRIQNRGNVPVETDFSVRVEIERDGNIVDERFFTVSEIIGAGSGKTLSYDWIAMEKSGNYDVNVEVDTQDDINEINEGNNQGYEGFRLRPVTFPKVIVNEEEVPQEETEFPDAGVPYNLTLVMENSDNDTLANSEVRIIENDATNAVVPTQRLDPDTVTSSNTMIDFETDENGTASLTITPRGNVLLSDKYSDLSVQDDINYYLRMTGEQRDGTDFRFIDNGNIRSYYSLEVADPGTMRGEGTSDLPNLESYSKIAMNGIYNIFAGFWGAVT